MKGIIIVLGSPNDDKGNLSEMAIGRNLKGIEEYKKHPEYKILVTGGKGNHFNRTNKPHAFYAKQFLLEKNISEEDILELAESRFTVEDATLAKLIVDKYQIRDLIVVSSDFHMERVKFIFERVFKRYNLTFSEARTNFSKEEWNKLVEHEKKEIARMKKEGIS